MICDDFEAVQGHKIILSEASPLLDKLMMFNNPLVYLRGVKSEFLKLIFEYIYKGSVSLKEDQVGTFITLSQELEIRGMKSNRDSSAEHSAPLLDNTGQPNNVSLESTATDDQRPTEAEDFITNTGQNFDSQDRFSCDQCDFTHSKKGYLKRHKLKLHRTTFSCKDCDYTTMTENHMKIHQNYIHSIKSEYLDETNEESELEKLLQDDQEDTDAEETGEVSTAAADDLEKLQDDLKNISSSQCPGCDRMFRHKCLTIRHFKTVHLRERFACEMCGFSSSFKSSLKRHMKSKHPNV